MSLEGVLICKSSAGLSEMIEKLQRTQTTFQTQTKRKTPHKRENQYATNKHNKAWLKHYPYIKFLRHIRQLCPIYAYDRQ